MVVLRYTVCAAVAALRVTVNVSAVPVSLTEVVAGVMLQLAG